MGEITKALDWSTFSLVGEVFLKKKKSQNFNLNILIPRTKQAQAGILTFHKAAFTKECKAFYGIDLW